MLDDLMIEQLKDEKVTFTYDELKGLMEAMFDDGLLAGTRAYGDSFTNLNEASNEVQTESNLYKENSDLFASLVMVSKNF